MLSINFAFALFGWYFIDLLKAIIRRDRSDIDKLFDQTNFIIGAIFSFIVAAIVTAYHY